MLCSRIARGRRLLLLLHHSGSPKPSPPFCYTQKSSYVDVKMKWKKDDFFDSIDVVDRSKDLRAIVSLKNIMIATGEPPEHAIPVSAVSKMDRILEIPIKVSGFLRRYPSFFKEFTGPEHNLPWFKLTPEAVGLDREEKKVFEDRRPEFVDRVRRLILMSREKRLPLQIVQGMQWYLGLPEDFVRNPEENSGGRLCSVDMGDGVRGLSAAVDCDERVLSVLQRNALKKIGGGALEEPPSAIAFPLFPSKGVRLKRKISQWLEEFQRIPYISPYEDSSGLNPNSSVAEKRVAGVLHELLSLFVHHSAERRKIRCLREHLGLPQKFDKKFEHHPHIFYLLLKNKTCTVVLKEAYRGGSTSAIERHPILDVRKKYVRLMKESEIILKNRRSRKPVVEPTDNISLGNLAFYVTSEGEIYGDDEWKDDKKYF